MDRGRMDFMPGIARLLVIAAALVAAWQLAGCRGRGNLVISGTIEARDAELASRLAGRVVRVYVREGEKVRRGQLLVEFDSAPVRARVRELEAVYEEAQARLAELEAGTRREEVEKAQARVEAARARAGNAQAEFRRAKRLHLAGVLSDDDFERIEALYRTTSALLDEAQKHLELLRQGARREQVEAARAAVGAAKARLQRARIDLKEVRLRAPWAGVLEVFDLEPGDFIRPGVPVARIADPTRLWVRAYVPENLLGLVPVGTEVRVRVDSFPEHTFKGQVQMLATEAEFTPRSVQAPEDRALQVFAVRVDLLDVEGLRAGMAADVILPRGKI